MRWKVNLLSISRVDDHIAVLILEVHVVFLNQSLESLFRLLFKFVLDKLLENFALETTLLFLRLLRLNGGLLLNLREHLDIFCRFSTSSARSLRRSKAGLSRIGNELDALLHSCGRDSVRHLEVHVILNNDPFVVGIGILNGHSVEALGLGKAFYLSGQLGKGHRCLHTLGDVV